MLLRLICLKSYDMQTFDILPPIPLKPYSTHTETKFYHNLIPRPFNKFQQPSTLPLVPHFHPQLGPNKTDKKRRRSDAIFIQPWKQKLKSQQFFNLWFHAAKLSGSFFSFSPAYFSCLAPHLTLPTNQPTRTGWIRSRTGYNLKINSKQRGANPTTRRTRCLGGRKREKEITKWKKNPSPSESHTSTFWLGKLTKVGGDTGTSGYFKFIFLNSPNEANLTNCATCWELVNPAAVAASVLHYWGSNLSLG